MKFNLLLDRLALLTNEWQRRRIDQQAHSARRGRLACGLCFEHVEMGVQQPDLPLQTLNKLYVSWSEPFLLHDGLEPVVHDVQPADDGRVAFAQLFQRRHLAGLIFGSSCEDHSVVNDQPLNVNADVLQLLLVFEELGVR